MRLDFEGYKQDREVARSLEKATIIADCGVRLGTCEVTRRGMKEIEMEQIAEFIKQVIIDKREQNSVRRDVQRLLGDFQEKKLLFAMIRLHAYL